MKRLVPCDGQTLFSEHRFLEALTGAFDEPGMFEVEQREFGEIRLTTKKGTILVAIVRMVYVKDEGDL